MLSLIGIDYRIGAMNRLLIVLIFAVFGTGAAAELGLSRSSVLGWTARASAPAVFVPVEVVLDPRPTPPPALALVSPRGYRVEGLDAATIAVLLERLG